MPRCRAQGWHACVQHRRKQGFLERSSAGVGVCVSPRRRRWRPRRFSFRRTPRADGCDADGRSTPQVRAGPDWCVRGGGGEGHSAAGGVLHLSPLALAPLSLSLSLFASLPRAGIDASCVEGYTGGIITNCTSRNVDHAVAIVGADTDPVSGVDYWIVRNSWNTTFGEAGYFKMQRDTQQMGIFGGYFGCYEKDCAIKPGPPGVAEV